MAGVAGKSGRKDKLWRDALMVAVKREDQDGRVYLARIAEQCIAAALDGDIQAMKEIGDRLDGKAHQSVTTTVRDARQLTDAELIALISEGSGEGVIEPQAHPQLTH